LHNNRVYARYLRYRPSHCRNPDRLLPKTRPALKLKMDGVSDGVCKSSVIHRESSDETRQRLNDSPAIIGAERFLLEMRDSRSEAFLYFFGGFSV